MCCDGTLFTFVEVAEDELSAVQQIFTLHAGAKGPVFHQPCTYNREHTCMVYNDRPQTCRAYRCKTLLALDAGEIALPEAARRVAETLGAKQAVEGHLECGETLNAARERRAIAATDQERSKTQLAFILKLTALDLMLDRYFRKRGKTMLS